MRLRLFNPAQTRAARALLNWPVSRLAAAADLETEALEIFEAADGELGETELRRLAAAIRDAGVVAVRARDAGEGVRFLLPAARTPFVTAPDGLPDWLPLADGDEPDLYSPGSAA